MTINQETISELIKQMDLQNLYDSSETATPKHLMYAEFVKHTEYKQLPKLIYYIIMNTAFPGTTAKANSGELGYKLKLKNKVS